MSGPVPAGGVPGAPDRAALDAAIARVQARLDANLARLSRHAPPPRGEPATVADLRALRDEIRLDISGILDRLGALPPQPQPQPPRRASRGRTGGPRRARPVEDAGPEIPTEIAPDAPDGIPAVPAPGPPGDAPVREAAAEAAGPATDAVPDAAPTLNAPVAPDFEARAPFESLARLPLPKLAEEHGRAFSDDSPRPSEDAGAGGAAIDGRGIAPKDVPEGVPSADGAGARRLSPGPDDPGRGDPGPGAARTSDGALGGAGTRGADARPPEPRRAGPAPAPATATRRGGRGDATAGAVGFGDVVPSVIRCVMGRAGSLTYEDAREDIEIIEAFGRTAVPKPDQGRILGEILARTDLGWVAHEGGYKLLENER